MLCSDFDHKLCYVCVNVFVFFYLNYSCYLGIFVFRFLLLIDCYLEAIVLCLWRLLVILVVLRSVYDLNSNCYLGVVGLL